MNEEIQALREEIAKLRERIAVLEARPTVPLSLFQVGPGFVKNEPAPRIGTPLPGTVIGSLDARQ